MTSEMDLIDDIFSQPNTQKTDRPVGRFQPKAKKKIEKVVLPSLTIHSKSSQPNENDVSNNHHYMQVSVTEEHPGSCDNSLMIECSSSKKNNLQAKQQEKPQIEVDIGNSTVDSLDIDFREPDALSGQQKKTLDPLPQSHELFDGSQHASLFENLVPPSHPVLAEEGLNQVHSDAANPECRIDSEAASGLASEGSFDDFIIQSIPSGAKNLGMLRPKNIMQCNSDLPPKEASIIHDVTESIDTPVVGLHNYDSIDKISKHQANEPPVNLETRKSHTEVSAPPLDPENCFIRQAIDTFSHRDSHFFPDNNEDTSIPSNHYISGLSLNFSVAEDPPYNDPVVDYMVSGFSTDVVPDHGLDGEISYGNNTALASLEDADKTNFENDNLGISKDDQKTCEERISSRRNLRKRNAVHAANYDFEGEGNEDSEPFNTMESDKDNDDDSDYTGEKMSIKKKLLQKSKSLSGEKQKPARKLKKTSDEVHPTEKEPVKKRFTHSTRRKRRQVDKLLLETPEDEIDERKLPIKDLILLAEAREKLSMKEVASKKQSNGINSSSHVFNDNHIDGESIYADGQDHSHDDENGANPEAKWSPPKINYHSFMDKRCSPRWSKVDTELFYQAIRQFGTDFAMIQQLFPSRTRHQVKLKFKNEERKHPLQIADALICRSKDISQFEVVIQQLQAQAAQNSSKDAIDEEALERQDISVEKENEEVGKSEPGEDDAAEGLSQQERNSPEKSPCDFKYDEYQNVFDFSEFGDGDASYVGTNEYYEF